MGLREWLGIGRQELIEEKLAETSYPSNQIDPDDHLYRSLGGASSRELAPYVHERALRLAWQLHESNPLAHGIVEVMKDHVIGEGVEIQTEDDEIRRVLTQHWKDQQNKWETKQHDRVRELSLFGEQCYITFVNPANGRVKLASVDPLNIREVWCNKENPEDVIAIVVNDRGAGSQHWQGDKVYRVIHEDEDPESDTFGFMVGAKTDAKGEVTETFKYPKGDVERTYDGSCFWFTINKVSHAKRGRSDILSILDWLDIFDQMHMNYADRILLMNMFIWDVTLENATGPQVQNWMRENGATPKPATVRVHNQGEKWAAVSPDLKASEFDTQQKNMKSQILSSSNLPPHWFGEQDANRATSVEMGSPTYKRLTSRQTYVKMMLTEIFRFQLDQAVLAGDLKPRAEDEDEWAFEVVMAEISVRDVNQSATAFNQAVQALSVAWNANFVDEQEAQNILVILAAQLGADINIEEMRERIEAQKKEKEEAAMKMMQQQAELSGAAKAESTKDDDKEESGPMSEAIAIAKRVALGNVNGHR